MKLKNFIAHLSLTLIMIGIAIPAFAQIKIGLVLDKGGRHDKSFNAAAYKGAMKAKKDLHVFVKTVEATDDNSYEPMLRAFARRDFNVVIAIGFAQREAVRKIAAEFPKVHFAIVDAKVHAPNVKSMVFAEQEGSYLVGAIAALKTKTNKIGFIGGMDIPLIRRFQMGFVAGVKKINPKIKIVSNFVGITGDAWNNPPKAKELALDQYTTGVDIIFSAAGASNMGVFDAAAQEHKFAIGVDSNQDWIKPGWILTSMLKRVDVAVYKLCQDVKDGHFTPGIEDFNLANNGVGYAVDQYNSKLLTPLIRKRVDKLKAEIIAKKITVPDYYKLK